MPRAYLGTIPLLSEDGARDVLVGVLDGRVHLVLARVRTVGFGRG